MKQPANSGFFRGTLKYDWPGKRSLITYTTSRYNELLRFNTSGGYPSTNNDGVAQTISQWSTDCKCSSAVTQASQPILFVNTDYLTQSGSSYQPKRAGSGVKSVSFGSDGFPTRAEFTDGKTYTYSGCSAQTFSSSIFEIPDGCSCNKPTDVVLVLDRSCSIDKTEFLTEKQFTSELVKGFNVGPENTNIGITNFHTWTWDGPVGLNQGTSPSQVQTGASALQCWDGTTRSQQCLVNTGSNPDCCGCGTCISCGIVNGADMLATSTRASASKILIILTDGYHNLVLNKDGNNLNRLNGKPNGLRYKVGTKTCSEQDSSLTDPCYQGLTADLQWAVDYAKAKVPGVQIFAVGVGDVWKQHQLEVIADGKPSNVIGTKDWNLLPSLVGKITQLVCPSTTQCPTGCCGFCACATSCVTPDGCSPGNLCLPPSGPCCTTPTTPDQTVCNKPDKCFSYACDPKLNNGQGGCAQTGIPPKPAGTCVQYKCNPNTGASDPFGTPGVECGVNNACIKNVCDGATMTCKTTTTECTGDDKCFDYTCDPVKGCVKTSNVPVNDECKTYSCDPKTGQVTFQTALKCCPPCDDKNECTTDRANPGDCKCIFTPKNCSGDNKCVDYDCDPKKGCTAVPKPLPPETQCDHFTCDSKTGVVSQQDLCCRNRTCNDENKCTADVRDNCTCVFTPVPCPVEPNKCKTVDCDPKLGCVTTDNPIPKDDKCHWYTCDPANGVVTTHTREECCPCEPADKCSICKAENGTCSTKMIPIPDSNCTQDNKCKKYWCDPKEGCKSEDLPVPADTCLTYHCDPKTGDIFNKPKENICDDNNKCTVEECVMADPQNQLTARCVYTNVPCDDNNPCTIDTCEPAVGCVFTPRDKAFCDDHNLCTIDSCNATSTNLTYPCEHEPVVCNDTDVCHEIECRPLEGCVETSVICPVTDNCTISGCNATDDLGCYIESAGVCGAPVAAVGGLAGGIMAGIVVAALAGALVTSGGAVAAFGQGAGSPLNAAVKNNPLYQESPGTGYNPLFAH